MHLKNVTLELSSKPFRDESGATMNAVARQLFTQWKPLTNSADQVSIMLWIADGSEILEYTGNLDQTFEWAYWCGVANPIPFDREKNPNLARSTHFVPRKYIPDAAPRPYRWLKRLIETLRRVGGEISGKPIRIGATFDNGPEFAVSPFKYQRHKEIAQGHTMYPNSFVTCNSLLHADPQPYAAYPNGIPEGTSLGEFLGKQYTAFARDLGYDYLWMSNGMGFGTETWGVSGALFDRHAFHPEKTDEAAATMLRFWKEFYDAAPGVVVETRGSNFSAGTEIASDAAPLRELYRDYKIAPPVNSPWAALNFHSGLELVAWMSHVATLPDDRFPYRFYTHDPWFLNSPWLDRYGREPWDIFQPLSIGRIDEKGAIQTPNSISFLTADDTWGQLPDQVPMEVIPHIYDAFNTKPDAAGPFVWVYPFTEYNDYVRDGLPNGGPRIPDTVFNEDQYLGYAVEAGFPLNTVVNTENFRALAAADAPVLKGAVLVLPASVLFAENNRKTIEAVLGRGGRALVYGPLTHAPDEALALLGLARDEPVDGLATLEHRLGDDGYERGAPPATFHVHAPFCGGGLVETPASDAKDLRVLATAVQDGRRRVLASAREVAGGRLVYVRSALPCPVKINTRGHQLELQNADQASPVQRLMRLVMTEFGWSFRFQGFDAKSLPPRICLSRNDGAMYLSTFCPDTSSSLNATTPLGAPLLTEIAARVENDAALWHPGKAWHKECRCFAKQKTASVITAKTLWAAFPDYESRRAYNGLVDAEVHFFPPKGYEDRMEFVLIDYYYDMISDRFLTPEWVDTPFGRCARLKSVTGNLLVSWRKK